MTTKLDPFQQIVGVSWDSGVLAENVGTVTLADQLHSSGLPLRECVSADLPLDEDCPTARYYDGWYETRFLFTLRCAVQFCSEYKMTALGKTSAVSTYVGWAPQLNAIPKDCTDLCTKTLFGGNPTYCMLTLPSGIDTQVQEVDSNGNYWDATQKRWFIAITLFSQTQLGYTLSESLDVTIAAVTLPITLIEAWFAGDLRVTVPGHNLKVGSLITISDTLNYDGVYEVKSVVTDRITVAGTYVEDETSGTLAPKYDSP